ncbi:MAG: NUDIX hydrolase [Candidatus Aenigmarchaeota archaeon]|nr:NUDIX hydrolase [Candidatus Aenigmarchaeota archaeon]
MTQHTVEEQATLLRGINAELAKRNLKPLSYLGEAGHGEIGITGMPEFFDHSSRFFTDAKFPVSFPGGQTGHFTIRFNANGATADGAVIVALINGRYALVRQYRPALGRWTLEVPRGFSEPLDSALKHDGLFALGLGDFAHRGPLATALRELSEEVIDTGNITDITHLGSLAENTGTHHVEPDVFLFDIEVDADTLAKRLRGSEGLKVVLLDPDEAVARLGREITDAHSITALALAMLENGHL